jgi:hypothetical protein
VCERSIPTSERQSEGCDHADWRKPKTRRCSAHPSGPFPSISASLSPFGCRPSRMASTMSGARPVSGEQPADVGVRDPLLLRKVSDRLSLTSLDLPPPAVRSNQRLDQRLVAARFPCRDRHTLRRHDQLSAPRRCSRIGMRMVRVSSSRAARPVITLRPPARVRKRPKMEPPGPPAPRRGCESRQHAA